MNQSIEDSIISDIKGRGQKDKITGAALANPFGLKSIAIREIVNKYRSKPHCLPIASNKDGYWYATTIAEIESTDEHLLARISGIQNARTGLQVAKQRMANELQEQGRLI